MLFHWLANGMQKMEPDSPDACGESVRRNGHGLDTGSSSWI